MIDARVCAWIVIGMCLVITLFGCIFVRGGFLRVFVRAVVLWQQISLVCLFSTQAISAYCTGLLVNNICRFKKKKMEMDKNDELKFYIFKILLVHL